MILIMKWQRRVVGLMFLSAVLFSAPSFGQDSSGNATKVSSNSTDLTEPSDSAAPDKALAEPVKTANNNAVLSGVSGGGQKLRLQGFLTHSPRRRFDQDTFTDVLMRGDYSVSKKHRFRLQQSFTKLYTKQRNQYEFQPSDSVVAHYYSMDWKPGGTSLQWRTALSLPISNASARDDLLTRLTGSLIGIKTFFGGKLIAIGVPYLRYHAYEYKTSVSGRPLPLYTVGASASAIYMITSKLSFATSLGYEFEGTSSSQFEQDPETLNNGGYAVDVDLSYQALPELSFSLAYNQGANYMQDGRYELVLYDNEVSRTTFGMIYTY